MIEQLHSNVQKAKFLVKLFIVWNVLFFIIALLANQTIAQDAVAAILIRGGILAVVGFMFLYILGKVRGGSKSSWVRMSIISIALPLGTIVFLMTTPHVPLWFDVGQVGSALLLIGVAFYMLHSKTRHHFKKSQPTAQD